MVVVGRGWRQAAAEYCRGLKMMDVDRARKIKRAIRRSYRNI